MRRRVGVFMAGLASLAAVGAAAWVVLAQQNVPDGTFVQAADGTVYAVGSGAKIRLAPVPDTGGILSGLRDGPSAATVDELYVAMIAVAPTPVITSPVDPLIGQGGRVCTEPDVAFQVDVTDAQWQRTVVGRDATGSGMWAVVFVNITNLMNRDESPQLRANPPFQLVDERERKFEGQLGGAMFEIQHDLASAGGLSPFEAQLRPGITEQRVVAFVVAPDAQRLTLVSQAACR